MKEGYDLIVVGAGPAGLMAAKTAAEHNLKVALVERRKDISRWTRADCMMFYGLEGGFLGEDIHVEVGKIVFPRNGFSVNYRGGLYPLYNWRVLSPRGHRIDFTSEQPIAALFDKGILLRGLLGEVEKLGVTVLAGTLALEAANTHKGAKVLIKDGGEKHWLEARKVIAADGINSRLAELYSLKGIKWLQYGNSKKTKEAFKKSFYFASVKKKYLKQWCVAFMPFYLTKYVYRLVTKLKGRS